jgi:hypothetical protein
MDDSKSGTLASVARIHRCRMDQTVPAGSIPCGGRAGSSWNTPRPRKAAHLGLCAFHYRGVSQIARVRENGMKQPVWYREARAFAPPIASHARRRAPPTTSGTRDNESPQRGTPASWKRPTGRGHVGRPPRSASNSTLPHTGPNAYSTTELTSGFTLRHAQDATWRCWPNALVGLPPGASEPWTTLSNP